MYLARSARSTSVVRRLISASEAAAASDTRLRAAREAAAAAHDEDKRLGEVRPNLQLCVNTLYVGIVDRSMQLNVINYNLQERMHRCTYIY